jgi:hypothetical protein
MQGFGQRRPARADEVALPIKVRVTSGWFHREHSRHGCELMDSYLAGSPAEFEFQELESGRNRLSIWRYRPHHGHRQGEIRRR